MQNKNLNIRTVDFKRSKVQVRDNQDGTHTVSGYAIVFDQPSEDLDGFTEIVKPEALDNVDLSKCLFLYGHDPNKILARADSDTLTLKVDDQGLLFTAQLANTTLANDLVADIQAGNVKGNSFGFILPEDGSGESWDTQDDGSILHTITQIDELLEISATPIPAYAETSISVQRSLSKFKKGVNKVSEENNNLADAIRALTNVAKSLKDAQQRDDQPADNNQSQPNNNQQAKPQFKIGDVAVLSADDKPGEKGAIAKVTAVNDDGSLTVDYVPTEGSDEVKGVNVTADQLQPTDKPYPADNSDQPNSNQGSDNGQPENSDDNDNQQKERSHNMKNITPENQKKDAEVRSLTKFLKEGKRDTTGFDSTAGAAVLPSQVLDVMAQPEDPMQLSGYVTKVQVTAPAGKLPVLKKASARLASATELAENPAIAAATISQVNYDVTTLRGQLPISFEMVQDYPNIIPLLTQYVNDVKGETEQEKVGAVLQTATAVAATTVDDVKNAFNTGLVNYGADRVFVVSESAFAWLDVQKDDNGRYLLQDSISAPTGKILFGAPLLEVADTVLGAAGDKKIFVGSLKAFVLEAIKGNLTLEWVKNENFEQILGVALRADFKAADTDAGKLITVSDTTTTTTSK